MQNISIKTRSHYSCGLAVGTPEQYFKAAKEKDISCIVITDFCTLGGALDFYNKKKKADINIVIGVEFKIDYGGDLDTLPITLLCENQTGYTNLCRLVTSANKNNKVLNVQEIFDNKEGLVCFTPEKKHLKFLKPIFNYNFYLEISPYENRFENNKENMLSGEKLVASSDAYMPIESHKTLQDIMIQNSSFSSKDNTFSHSRYMMNNKEMITKFIQQGLGDFSEEIIQAIRNNELVTTQCQNIELKFKDQIVNYPHLLHRLNNDGCDKITLLRRIIKDNNRWDQDCPIYKERLEYEIDAISNNSRVDLTDYCLVNEDLCYFCKVNNIPVGPGRGSAAGSLIMYGLGVTHLDPIKYGLLFERFISKGRIEAGSLPDVDLDFANQDIVREYLIDLYGEDRVKPIGTYQTLATRGAIKDAFRTFYPEEDFSVSNRITFSIDDKLRQEEDKELDFFNRQITENEDFAGAIALYPLIVEPVRSLVGYNRQQGVHPCGLAITQDPIDDFIPTRITGDKQVLEYTGDGCEQSGIIKYDILGLKTLKYFKTCLELIDSRYSKEKDWFEYPETIYDIPLDDPETYRAFEAGNTESVFQFNSDVAKSILTKIKINSLDDLSMITSVGRPGPMKNGQHMDFIKRKSGKKKADPPHPALKELLEDTLGVMIYQESVMKTAQLMGGYSLAETDNIRKAMGKKKIEILMEYKKGFIDYCEKNFPDTTSLMPQEKNTERVRKSEYIWNLMETFSGYGFNKSHSMCYALIGYYCQYLKVHFPLEWWTACLTHEDKPENIKRFYAAYKHRISLPSINKSTDKYEIEYCKEHATDEYDNDVEGFIIMPFNSIKKVGGVAGKSIQDNTPYSSFADFYERAKSEKGRRVNKGVVANLIFAGAFDVFETNKEKLFEEYYALRKDKKIPQEHQNITRDFEQEMKHQVMDFLTLDYIAMYPHLFSDCIYPSAVSLIEEGDKVSIVGKIIKVNNRVKKNKEKFLVLQVSNKDEVYDVTVWTEEYKFYKDIIAEKNVVKILGKVSHGFKENQIHAGKIHTLKDCMEFGGTNI